MQKVLLLAYERSNKVIAASLSTLSPSAFVKQFRLQEFVPIHSIVLGYEAVRRATGVTDHGLNWTGNFLLGSLTSVCLSVLLMS